MADGTLFRSAVPETQHWMVANLTALQRIAFGWRGALFDELVLRLGVVTGAIWLLRAAGLTVPRAVWPAILIAAFLAWPLTVLPYLSDLHWTTATVARGAAARRGGDAVGLPLCPPWLAGRVVGHWAAHVALQPLLGITG